MTRQQIASAWPAATPSSGSSAGAGTRARVIATVYLADDLKLHRKVALKVGTMFPAQLDQALAMTSRTGQAREVLAHDRAMYQLERASFLFKPLRSHPRFRALLGKTGLA